jgi:hypothetical protein
MLSPLRCLSSSSNQDVGACINEKRLELGPVLGRPWPNSSRDLRTRRAGWPWRLPARAPTDPDVRALAHPVLQPTVAIHKWPPKRSGRVTWTCLRTSMCSACFPRSSLSTDASLPSTGSSGASSPASTVLSKRYDFLPPIPPHFVTFVWRYLSAHSLCSLPGGRVRRRGRELVTRYLQPGFH